MTPIFDHFDDTYPESRILRRRAHEQRREVWWLDAQLIDHPHRGHARTIDRAARGWRFGDAMSGEIEDPEDDFGGVALRRRR